MYPIVTIIANWQLICCLVVNRLKPLFGQPITNVTFPPPPDFTIVSMYWERKYIKSPAPAFKVRSPVLLSKPVLLKRKANVTTLSTRVKPVT